jgi:hypothetical protein
MEQPPDGHNFPLGRWFFALGVVVVLFFAVVAGLFVFGFVFAPMIAPG